MSTPFPGMDPWLEAPAFWPGFHEAFLAYLREEIQPRLPEGYYADLQTREEIGIAGLPVRVFVPDLVVKTHGGDASRGAATTALRGLTEPEHVVIAEDEPLRVSFLEIRSVDGGRLITVIELLSPSNKAPGPDRDAYERKQGDILASDVNWVEIDLLRAGKRVACHPRVDLHARRRGHQYAVVVSRSWRRSPELDLEVYGFTVRGPLPVIALPLREADPDVPLDLGRVFARAFETGPYRKVLRYDEPPDPPLPAADAEWARDLLHDRGSLLGGDRPLPE